VAEGLKDGALEIPAASREPLVEVPAVRQQGRSSYRARFLLVYLLLAVVAGAAIGGVLLLIDRPAKEAAPAWSSWRPTGSSSGFPNKIAGYVSGRYRVPSGNPLVAVIAGAPTIQAGEEPVAIRAVAIHNDPEGEPNDVSIVPTDNGVMYQFCGLGPNCSIREGQPSQKRHQLLRREALELALYTFKYADGKNSVITLLPGNPAEPDAPPNALFFQKNQLGTERDQPLERTLQRAEAPRAAEIGPLEGSTIDRLTQSRLFTYEFQAAPAGGAILVLAPLAG